MPTLMLTASFMGFTGPAVAGEAGNASENVVHQTQCRPQGSTQQPGMHHKAQAQAPQCRLQPGPQSAPARWGRWPPASGRYHPLHSPPPTLGVLLAGAWR
jgi:hypothetical protein